MEVTIDGMLKCKNSSPLSLSIEANEDNHGVRGTKNLSVSALFYLRALCSSQVQAKYFSRRSRKFDDSCNFEDPEMMH